MSPKKSPRGKFIVLEGIDGSGTTTQAAAAADWLRGRGERVHLTREPSEGPIGTLVRQVLRGRLIARTAGGGVSMDPATVALLFAADRIDHLQNEVEPWLSQGYHVLCDRYVLSSLAYQSVDVDLKFVRQINDKAIQPDVTLFLSVAPETAMNRIAATRPDRDVFENLPFQRQVAEAYEILVRQGGLGEVVTIDGEADVGAVTGKVRAAIGALLD